MKRAESRNSRRRVRKQSGFRKLVRKTDRVIVLGLIVIVTIILLAVFAFKMMPDAEKPPLQWQEITK